MDIVTDFDLEDYLSRYAATLAAFDSIATADLWGVPGMMITDESVGVLDTRGDTAEGLAQSYPLYRSLGVTRVGYTVVDQTHLTDRWLRVRVRWHFLNADALPVADSEFEYTLRRDPDGLLAYVAIALDESDHADSDADDTPAGPPGSLPTY